MVEDINVNAGSYSYKIPAFFLPKYRNHVDYDNKYTPEYAVRYSFRIVSEQKITDIFTPDGSTTTIISEPQDGVLGTIFNKDVVSGAIVDGDELANKIEICFRTENMLKPRLIIEENPNHKDEVALMAGLVPTFNINATDKGIQVHED
jgi:hypothetical protein